MPDSDRTGAPAGASVLSAGHRATIAKRAQAVTSSRECRELRRELGAYLLGTISPADRSAVKNHLASCADCRDQLADLAGLPALLRRVPLEEVDSLAPAGDTAGSSSLADLRLLSLLQAVKRRRHRVWSQLSALAAVALALGGVAAYGMLRTPAQVSGSRGLPGAITVRGTNPGDGASAVVKFAGRPWGVQLYVQVTGIAVGTRCVFEVTDSSGHESDAGGWMVNASDEAAWYWASSSVPVKDVRGFVVTAGTRTILRVAVPRGR